jgi:hypothetical protein
VVAEHAAVVVDGARIEVERGEPDGDPLAERGLAAGGVESGVAALVGLDVVGVVLGGQLGGEAGAMCRCCVPGRSE